MNKIRITSPKGEEVSINVPLHKSYIDELNGLESVDKIDNLVEEGIPYYSVRPVFEILSLSQAEQASLVGVELRTISNWVKKNQLLGKTESMQLIELDKIILLGTDVFGDVDSFIEWFNTKNHAFGDKSPKECILRASGMGLVEEALSAMEYGNVL